MRKEKTLVDKTEWNHPDHVVFDDNALYQAHEVAKYSYDQRYWNLVKIPVNPMMASVPFERTRQVLVFALPAAALVAFIPFLMEQGLSQWNLYRAIAGSVIAAIVFGWILANMHQKSILLTIGNAKHRDAGRYALTDMLRRRYDLHPSTVTWDLVMKMDKLYYKMRERDAAEEAAKGVKWTGKQYTELRKAADNGAAPSELSRMAVNMGLPAVAATTVLHHINEGIGINPVNGLPLIAGTNIDVMGNAIGTNFNDPLGGDIGGGNSFGGFDSFSGGSGGGFDAGGGGFDTGGGGFGNDY